MANNAVFKRLYFKDMVILTRLCEDRAIYVKDLAESYGVSARAIRYSMAKLEKLGYVFRYGRPKCPYQAYRLRRECAAETMARQVAARLQELWAADPGRTYFIFDFVIATLPSSYWKVNSCPNRPGGCSVAYGSGDLLSDCIDSPKILEVAVPVECFCDLFSLRDEFFDSDGFDCFHTVWFRFGGRAFDLDSFDSVWS